MHFVLWPRCRDLTILPNCRKRFTLLGDCNLKVESKKKPMIVKKIIIAFMIIIHLKVIQRNWKRLPFACFFSGWGRRGIAYVSRVQLISSDTIESEYNSAIWQMLRGCHNCYKPWQKKILTILDEGLRALGVSHLQPWLLFWLGVLLDFFLWPQGNGTLWSCCQRVLRWISNKCRSVIT